MNVAKEEPKVQETASKPSALTFKGELAWPAAEEGKVIMNYSMDQTVYFFKSLDQYRYNPAVIIGAKVNDKVTSAAAGSVLDVSNNEVTGCTVTMNLGDGYKAIYGQLKEVSKKQEIMLLRERSLAISVNRQKILLRRGQQLIF